MFRCVLPEDCSLLGVHADGVLLVRVLEVAQRARLDVAAAAQHAAGDAQPDRLGGVANCNGEEITIGIGVLDGNLPLIMIQQH